MNNIKIILVSALCIIMFNGCAQNVALVGPAYSFVSTGSIYHAGLTYSSGEAINQLTGKTPTENLKEILVLKKDDTEFEKLIKKRVKEVRKKLNLTNQ